MWKKTFKRYLKPVMEYFCWSKFTAMQKILCGGSFVFILSILSGYWASFILFCMAVVSSNFLVSYLLTHSIPLHSEYLLYFVRSINSVLELFHLTGFSNSTKPTALVVKKDKVDQEIKKIVDLIICDFIKSWYETLSSEAECLGESQVLFLDASQNVKARISRINKQKCAKLLIDLYRQHIASYQVSKQTYQSLKEPKIRKGFTAQSPESKLIRTASIEEAFGLKFEFHPALKNAETEQDYLQNVIKIVFCKLFPDNFIFCNGAQILMNEILLTNVISALIQKFIVPDFLLWCIIKITFAELDEDAISNRDSRNDDFHNDASQKQFENFTEKNSSNNESFSSNSNSFSKDYEIPLAHVKPSSCIPTVKIEGDNSEYVCEKEDNSFRDYVDIDIENKTEYIPKEDDIDDDIYRKRYNSYVDIDIFHDVHDPDNEVLPIITVNGQNEIDVTEINQNVQPDSEAKFYLENNVSVESELKADDDDTLLADSSMIFQDVSIIDTETATEYRSQNHYTLYIVEFEAMYSSDSGSIVKSGIAKRRFREFVNLNSRLDDKSYYKSLLKDVKGPKRWLNLPFKNMDKESVESRKKFLEQFLKSLIEIEAICNGPELREFLAYEGDSHIAFVKKTSEILVPRIDKMLARTVSGMFDKIKSLPSLSQDVISGIVRRENSVDRKLDEKSTETDKIDLEFEAQDSVYPGHLEKFVHHTGDVNVFMDITNQTEDGRKKAVELREDMLSLLPRLQGDGSESPDSPMEDVNPCEQSSKCSLHLADSVLDLAIQIFDGQDVWLGRHRVLLMLKVVIGRALERFLQDELCYLTSEDQWQFYLSLIRETVWPNGKLSEEPEIEGEALRSKARKCLTDFFPGWLRTIVGLEELDYGIDLVIQSLQHEKLNKHFLFLLLEHLIEEIFPEVSAQELQATLLSS